MALFKPTTWGLVKVWRDFENYKDWRRILKREGQTIDSKFNKWKLQHNAFYTLYFTMDIEESESQLPEKIMQLRLFETLAPLHRYLDEELGFAECITPEFNRFHDEEGNPTLTFLISYRFSFDKFSLWWMIKWGAILTAAIVILKSGWIPKIIEWFGTLI